MLLALNGAKGAGKDSVAEILVRDYDFTRIGFADKLKESAAAVFGIANDYWNAAKNMPNSKVQLTDYNGIVTFSITAREFLQRYGTEAHRDIFGKDFWVEHALKGIYPAVQDYVITDCRFENEIERVKSLGGVVARVVRDSVDTNDTHASEAEPPPHLIDYYLDNNDSLENLKFAVDDLIEWIKEDDIVYEEDDEYEYYES